MTNATVAAVAGANDELKLTLTYKGGEQVIVVPRGIPLMTTDVGSSSMLVPGAHVIVYGATNPDGRLSRSESASARMVTFRRFDRLCDRLLVEHLRRCHCPGPAVSIRRRQGVDGSLTPRRATQSSPSSSLFEAVLALFAYVAVILSISVPWRDVVVKGSRRGWTFRATFPSRTTPRWSWRCWGRRSARICPSGKLRRRSRTTVCGRKPRSFARIRHTPRSTYSHQQDTYVGMLFSSLVALCIVVATVVTLKLNGITNIQTSSQAAEPLRPIAGEFAFAVLALGIIGTGLFPVGSTATSRPR